MSNDWAIEEKVEDALKTYLNNELPENLANVYNAWSVDKPKYPAIVIHAGESENTEAMGFRGIRDIIVEIVVMTEARQHGDDSARTKNATLRSEIMEALSIVELHQTINTLNPDGVLFSYAELQGMTRSVDPERRILVSTVELYTIVTQTKETTTTTTTTTTGIE